MRLFQNSAVYPAYLPRLRTLDAECQTFESAKHAFLEDRFGACHILQPVLTGEPTAFFTNGHDERLQRLWAMERGMRAGVSLREILYSQIEEHRTEIFYNLDPMRYQSEFIRGLPGCVKRSIAWRAAPSPGADFSKYDCVVCNFPRILDTYAAQGWNARYFFPAIDPVMNEYARRAERPTDILFVGTYSRHHRRRAAILERVADQCGDFRLAYHLDCSRLTQLAESKLGKLLPLRSHRRPACIGNVARRPVYGRDLYAALGNAKIVLNGAIDMAGEERGNMRCFEATGCGAVLVTDEGQYPRGFVKDQTMRTYSSAADVVAVLRRTLDDPGELAHIASRGTAEVRSLYSKTAQWNSFVELTEKL